jgi:hypothetical protein
MALRTKTIEYAFPFSSGSVGSATARTYTPITVNIPETTSRTFRSVIVDFSCLDGGSAGASATVISTGVQIGAVAVSTNTVTQTITNSGENQSFHTLRDATAYFQTNFTGTSQTVTVSMTHTGNATQNASAKIIITYEYDDSAATTRIKTVKIPIDGNNGDLTAAYVNVGGLANQIPALDTFLPEASKVYRNIFFEMLMHTGASVVTTSTLDVSYDGGTTTVADLTYATSLNTDISYRRIDVLTSTLNTTAAQSIQARAGLVNARRTPCFSGVLVVTYEYDHSTSTTIINSIQTPIMDEAGLSGGSTTADKSRFTRQLNIQEPGTITLVQSGIMASYVASGAVSVDFRVGSQASRVYAHPAASVRAGGMTHMRRIDAGAVGGVAGLTLARGYNELVVDWFATGTTLGTIPSNMSALLFLNYTSGKHADGDGVHSHTTIWGITSYVSGWPATTGMRRQLTSDTTPIIPETNYWLTGAGFQLILMPFGTSAGTIGGAFLGEVQAGEGEGAGFRPFYNFIYQSLAEISPSVMFARARDDMKRWPNDPDTNRLDIETTRQYRYDTNLQVSTTNGAIFQSYMMLTYHAITYTIAGTITNSAGGTVTITAHDDTNNLVIGSTTRTGNGSYSITWYDNTSNVYTEAVESSVLIGRSATGTAA